MFSNEIWAALDKLPELFKYGDTIYHLFKSIISIISNVASSIIAAIIFYYIVEFIGKKKDYEKYADIRKYILFMFYKHLKVLTRLNLFSEINKRKRRVPDFYDIYDIPVLVKLFKDIDTEEKILTFKKGLKDLFQTKNKNDIEKFADSFEKDIEEIINKTNYRYFKGSKDLIESICVLYKDDFQMISGMYASNNDDENKSDYIDDIVDDYFDFLNATMEFYVELENFIDCINKKKFGVFIKMLD